VESRGTPTEPQRRPNGLAGSREEIDKGRAEAREFAKKAVEHMKQTDEIVDPRSEESLEAAIEIVRAKAKDPLRDGQDYLYSAGDRLKAAKLVLEFTKAKPAAKNDVTIRRAEDFLEDLAGRM
jgi:hypothetical protein